MPTEASTVRTGLDNLCAALGGAGVGGPGDTAAIAAMLRSGAVCGLVANPASIAADLADAATALQRSGVKLGALFGPEHGAHGAAAAGEKVQSERDEATGLPVHSLYGKTVRPTPEMLEGLDAVIFDLQDLGVRFWTYMWTLSYMLEACGDAGIPVIVLDRPNPIGGEVIEGAVLEESLSSFVGRYPIPTRHGMTAGELARLFVGRHSPNCRLLVAGMSGWKRTQWWRETGLDWAAPSPNIPTPEAAMIYPATCFLEGTNISEGRGTPLPFQVFGAPGIDPARLASILSERTDSRWRPLYFSPAASKHSGATCGGVQWYPPRSPGWRESFRPVTLGLEILRSLREAAPEQFEWRIAATGRSHFDLLVGASDVRPRIDAGEEPENIAAGWDQQLRDFEQVRRQYLLY